MRMTAYGRKQPFGLSLNRPSLTSALEKKADIRVLELRAKANGRNRPKAAESSRCKIIQPLDKRILLGRMLFGV